MKIIDDYNAYEPGTKEELSPWMDHPEHGGMVEGRMNQIDRREKLFKDIHERIAKAFDMHITRICG